MKRKIILLAASFYFVTSGSAQILFSNGGQIFVSNGAIMITNGGTEIANGSDFINNGTFTVTLNSTLPTPGDFIINGASNVSGDGLYRVEQDWINDATFIAGNSEVELYGNTQQFITSMNGTVTTFNDLTLTGTGSGNSRKKTLQLVDANVGTNGILMINDRELETQTQTFYVLNVNPASVTNNTTAGSEGFVSSVTGGTFSRATNSAAVYLFPTGSSAGTLRYRPVELVPANTNANTYTVRFNNYDPNLDSYDRAINDGIPCVLNDLYYHSIERSNGTTDADLRLFFIPASDGAWAGMSQWQTGNAMWNDMSTVNPSTSGVFSTLTKSTWAFANPGDPYVLTNIRPEQPVISCPAICENSSGNIFSLTGNSSSYQWTLPSNGTITSGQGTDQVTADWTNGTGYVYVIALGTNGCNSLPDSCSPAVSPNPVADFTYSVSGNYNDNYAFNDQSTGATNWNWDFGDGNTNTSQNPDYQYSGAGTYTVLLTVSNAAGCSDTMTVVVTAGEGIFIPNVFSPNADGTNDEFYIQTSGLDEYSLHIYNRWGQLMFSSEDPNEHWNGKNLQGNQCPDGTYFFILKAKSNAHDYGTEGTVTIMGAK